MQFFLLQWLQKLSHEIVLEHFMTQVRRALCKMKFELFSFKDSSWLCTFCTSADLFLISCIYSLDVLPHSFRSKPGLCKVLP